ncbi:FHA domain-containing protein, partial [Pseudomonas viridiflava]|uniref:FHA domain-containing protein n=1 Tax=Pseudomonas viridiflava TaxID=33069 RepID=UPI00311AA6AF
MAGPDRAASRRSTALNGEQWSIGSSAGADLALYDPDIMNRHCTLRLVDETWSLASSEGPVTDSEG